jgi:hypothetical protein
VSLTNATVSCATVTGQAGFSPALRTPGKTSGIEHVHFNLTTGGCTSTALTPPATITGTLKGTLTTNTGTSCATALGTSAYSAVGTLQAHWKIHGARAADTSAFTPQRLAPGKVRHKRSGSTQSAKVGTRGKPHPSVTGDFTGGDGGRTATFSVTWKQTAATCASRVSSLPIVSGTLHFS